MYYLLNLLLIVLPLYVTQELIVTDNLHNVKQQYNETFLNQTTSDDNIKRSFIESHLDDIDAFDYDNDIEQMEYDSDTNLLTKNEKTIVQSGILIQLGVQSRLLANPGSIAQIYFELTNLRDIVINSNLQIFDEHSFYKTLTATRITLYPGQTIAVTVSVNIPPNVEIGTKDKITLISASGYELVTQSATLTVIGTSFIQDQRQPSLYWTFSSRCDGKTGAGQCASSGWSVEITTQDSDSGILRLNSNPKGLLIRNQYTAGTTNEIRATYTASCCSTRVTITVYDVAGNLRSATIDVTDIIINEAMIAAITLGALLLLLIIILIIVLIVWCCRRRKASRELPVYRSHREERT